VAFARLQESVLKPGKSRAPKANHSEEFARFIRDEIAIWEKVVKASGLRTE
jgi:tripartite-type tricarboxylate transporter receptor subunit TctC